MAPRGRGRPPPAGGQRQVQERHRGAGRHDPRRWHPLLHAVLPPRPVGRHLSHHRPPHRGFAGDIPLHLRRARGRAAGADEPGRHPVVHRTLRRLRRPDRRLWLRRSGDPHRRRPPVRQLPVPLLEPPRRPVRRAELGEPHPVRPRSARRRAQALRRRLPHPGLHERPGVRRGRPRPQPGREQAPGSDVAGVRRRLPARALALGGHAPGLVPLRHPLLPGAAHPGERVPEGDGLDPLRPALQPPPGR